MNAKQEICVLCAWRESCQKKFSISGKDVRCADFVKDLNIKPDKATEGSGTAEKKGRDQD